MHEGEEKKKKEKRKNERKNEWKNVNEKTENFMFGFLTLLMRG